MLLGMGILVQAKNDDNQYLGIELFGGVLNMFPLCSQMFLMGVPNRHHTLVLRTLVLSPLTTPPPSLSFRNPKPIYHKDFMLS